MMDNMQIKLADFGIAEVIDNANVIAQELIGTPWYLSPELCHGGELTFKSDIWALGVVLYRMCTLKYPFDADGTCSTVELIEQIATNEPAPIPDHYSPFLKSLISEMLKKDVSERPSHDDIINKEEMKVVINRLVEAGLTIAPDFRTEDFQK